MRGREWDDAVTVALDSAHGLLSVEHYSVIAVLDAALHETESLEWAWDYEHEAATSDEVRDVTAEYQ